MNKILIKLQLYGKKEAEAAELESKDALAALMMEGSFITNQANIGQTLDELTLSALRDRYLVWREEIKKFTRALLLSPHWLSIFAEAGAISTGGLLDYADKRGLKFQKLINDIREETKFVLENLRALGLELFGEKKIAGQKAEAIVPLPEGASWEKMEIKFKNKFDVEIFINDKYIGEFNNETLGFIDGRTKDKKQDRQWDFLYKLSAIQDHPEHAHATMVVMADSLETNKENVAKIKDKLSAQLQKVFGLTPEPFYKYEANGWYQTKFGLRPDPILRGNGEIFPITTTEYNDAIDYDAKSPKLNTINKE